MPAILFSMFPVFYSVVREADSTIVVYGLARSVRDVSQSDRCLRQVSHCM